MTTASVPLSTSSVNSMGSPIPQHGHMAYSSYSNNNASSSNYRNSYHSLSGSAPNSPTLSQHQYNQPQNQHLHHHSQYSHNHSSSSQHHNNFSSSYTNMPLQGGESRRTPDPASGLSSSYPATSSELRPRDHSVEPRMSSYHASNSNSQYPPTPAPFKSPASPHYSNHPGSRSSWAGQSTAELESKFSLTSVAIAGSSSSSSRRSEYHDTQDDYHHSPQHGTYIPPPSSSSSAVGHQEYRTNNSSSNSLDDLHHSYNNSSNDGYNSSQQSSCYRHKREDSMSSLDYHYQASSNQDGYPADHHNGDNHGECGEDGGGGIGSKLRNNSVSSNASQSSTSSLSHYHPHMNGNKHPCKFPTCGWSFKRYEHLKRHMLVHTKERAFVCDYHGCEKSFSRSDNFSAHLRTHTKKSAAAAAAAAAGTTTAHIRRFERQQQQMAVAVAAGGGEGGGSMVIDPIRTNFPNSSTSALMSSGPLSDAPLERRNGAAGGGGAEYAHHRHSIAGYPSYSGGSRSPLQMQNIYSHGLPTPVTNHGPNSATTSSARNSYCGLSSATSDDNIASSDYEQQHQQQQPKFGALTAELQQQQQHQQQQQYHKRSPSSGMHPLDSPATATTTTSTGPIPGTISGTVDGIVPKFNTIKLDLKSVTNHPEDLSSSSQQQKQQEQQYHGYQQHHQQYQYQHHRQQHRRRFSNPEADQDDENVEFKRSDSVLLGSSPSPHSYHNHNRSQRNHQQQQQHRYSNGSIPSQLKSENVDEDLLHQRQRFSSSQRHVSIPGLGRERELCDDDGEEDQHYYESASSDTVTGYEHPNPNPNGESPVLAPRRLSGSGSGAIGDDEMKTISSTVKYEQQSSSMNFPASISSHFTPASTSRGNNNNNKGSPSRQDSPVMGDILDGPLKNISGNDDGRGLSSLSNSSLVSANRRPSSSSAAHMSGSYQHLNGSVSPPRSNSDSYSGSVPMDEDGNPLHPPSQHRHHSGYHHSQPPPQHHYGDYDRAGGYPPSPHMHHQHYAAGSTSSSLYYQHQGGQPQRHYSGPSSSSSMNGGYSTHHGHHPQYPSYQHSEQHQQSQSQYAMDESSGSYHQGHPAYPVHHGHPNQHHNGMPPMPASSSSSHMQQQSQPLPQPQASQRIAASGSGNAFSNASTSGATGGSSGGGRVRGMTSSAKNHCCPVSGCMKRFKRLEHLKRHTKTHTLERPFACSTAGCNKRFSRSDNLSQHIKTHQRQMMSKLHWKQ